MTSREHRDYNKGFYEKHGATESSARIISSLINSVVRPKSVVDVGCGKGVWLKQFQQLGVEQIVGIDGNWVDRKSLLIDGGAFLERDLEKPIQLDRKFDLVISLEVAEHLAPSAAERFVRSLVNLGDVVLFSAAVPHQGGVHHVNEQWPDYWVDLFSKFDFEVFDCIRRPVWQQEGVIYYYAQNCFLFASKSSDKFSQLSRYANDNSVGLLRVIHPNHYLQKIRYLEDPQVLSTLGIRILLSALRHAVFSRLGIRSSQ